MEQFDLFPKLLLTRERLGYVLRENMDSDSFDTWIRPCDIRVEESGRRVVFITPPSFLSVLRENLRPAITKAVNLLCEGTGVEFEARQEPPPVSEPVVGPKCVTLSPAFTPELFVVGPSNSFAAQAVERLIEERPAVWSPFGIYGAIGLGKTHLLHSIGHGLLRRHPTLKVVCVTAMEFVNEFVPLARFNRDGMPAFREKFRGADVLLIDEVEALAGKHRSMEEFLYTLKELRPGSVVAFTCHVPPPHLDLTGRKEELAGLAEELRGWLAGGLWVELEALDEQTMRAIVQQVISQRLPGQELPEAALDLIIEAAPRTARELRGIATQVAARLELTPHLLDYGVIHRILATEVAKEPVKATEVVKEVARQLGVSAETILRGDLSADTTLARHTAMYVLCEVTGLSFEKIGEAFGGRHHSTVRSALVRIKEEVVKSERLARVVARLVQRFSRPLPSMPGEVVRLPPAAAKTPATCGFATLGSAVSGALPARRTAG